MPQQAPVDLLDVISFVRVVETGSIVNAATRLDLAKSIVSRRISRLEAVLGAKLLIRTPRGTTLTDVGREYYTRAAGGLAELESAREVVNKLTSDISGLLRVQIQTAFGEFVMAPLLAEFAQLHPRIQFDICFEDRRVDMNAEAFDIAIKPGSDPDLTLITRRLAKIRWAIVASPAYLDAQGRPARPLNMAGHRAMLHSTDPGNWRFQSAPGAEHVQMNSELRTDNGQMLLAAVRAGLGVARLPRFMVEDSLERGELEEVLPDFPHESDDLQIFIPPARTSIARVRALVNFLYEKTDREV